jgi:signal transduction histidine kinase
MRVTKLYRALKAELDGLEGQKENSGSTSQDSADHLAHSHKICGHLRKLAHALISAEEEGRTQLGKALQNDILQMMVGIHIRLLNLDRDVFTEGSLIKNEIAMIQQMVKESADLLSGMSDRKPNEC